MAIRYLHDDYGISLHIWRAEWGRGMTDRLHSGNILEPLTFTEQEIGKFQQRNRCAICRGYLNAFHVEGRKWMLKCLTHGPITAHNYTSIWTVEKIEQEEMNTELSTKEVPHSGRKPNEIIEELGF